MRLPWVRTAGNDEVATARAHVAMAARVAGNLNLTFPKVEAQALLAAVAHQFHAGTADRRNAPQAQREVVLERGIACRGDKHVVKAHVERNVAITLHRPAIAAQEYRQPANGTGAGPHPQAGCARR